MTTDDPDRTPPGARVLNYAPTRRPRRKWIVVTCAVAAGMLLLAVMLPSLNSRDNHAPELKCASNLRQIGQGVQMYANENKGAFPDDLTTLILTQDLTSEVFVCYRTNDTRADGPTTRAVAANLTAGGHLSYVYTGKGMSITSPATAVLAYEPLSNHGDFMYVLFADGRIERLSAKQGQKILAELAAGHNPPRAEAMR